MKTPTPFYKDDITTLYCCNSSKLINTLKGFDLLLTDPPYGLNKSWERKFHGNNGTTKLWGSIPEWDKKTVDFEILSKAISNVKRSIVFGGNYYPFPPSRCWIVWDKLQSNRGADCELAWTNLDLPTKVFRMSRIDAYENKAVFPKFHGAEKPVQLGRFIMDITRPKSVVDIFMGSGSFIIAARERGTPCLGIDANEDCCKEVVRRINSRTKVKRKGFGMF